jgi:hypothetical protein
MAAVLRTSRDPTATVPPIKPSIELAGGFALADASTAAAAASPARALQQRLAQSIAPGDARRWSPRATFFFIIGVNAGAWTLIALGVKLLLH